MTMHRLDVAVALDLDDWSIRHVGNDAGAVLHRPVARTAAVSVKNRPKVLRAERDWSQADLAGHLASRDRRSTR